MELDIHPSDNWSAEVFGKATLHPGYKIQFVNYINILLKCLKAPFKCVQLPYLSNLFTLCMAGLLPLSLRSYLILSTEPLKSTLYMSLAWRNKQR